MPRRKRTAAIASTDSPLASSASEKTPRPNSVRREFGVACTGSLRCRLSGTYLQGDETYCNYCARPVRGSASESELGAFEQPSVEEEEEHGS